MREPDDKVSECLDHLVSAFGRLEVLTRFAVTLLDPLDPKAQRGRRRNRFSPNHIPKADIDYNIIIKLTLRGSFYSFKIE